MGLFDDIDCEYPLPVRGANKLGYQTKDTPRQCLDRYLIKKDGTLWVEDYEIVDRSDLFATGLARIAGMCTRINVRLVRDHFSGDIYFYTCLGLDYSGWLEFNATFLDGVIQRLQLVKHREPDLVEVKYVPKA